MKSSTKRLLSLVIVLAMALSMLPMIALAAETPTTLYVKPNTNWRDANARFAAYFFGAGETWVSCTDEDGDGVYKVDVPAGGYTSVIFCRMNPNAAANNWNNKWNQTSDLKIADAADGKVCYVVAEGSWDKGKGEWVTYVEGEDLVTTPTAPNAYEYYVAGVKALCGVDWDPCNDDNGMTKGDNGIYTKIYMDVPAGSYKFKVTDGTWSNAWPSQDYALNVEALANVAIIFNSTDKTVSVDVQLLEEPLPTTPTVPAPATYIVAGVDGLCGSGWNPADASNLMSETGAGTYSITYSAVPAGAYEFKVTDGTWNNAWPAENYKFELVTQADVTINFNAADKSIEVVSDGLKQEEETEPTTTEPFVPGVREYCLVGWINGADYGCNEDHENVGEYIFVDGKLTVTFTEDSYIFVKTTDNANWFLTEAFTTDTTATFIAGASEKMKAPGNVELTFTLTENEDGSIVVSYEGAPAPEPLAIESVHVVGDMSLTGADWNPATNAMTAADGIYTLTFENVSTGTYQFKFAANGTWDLNWTTNGTVESGVQYDAEVNAFGNTTIQVPGDGATVTMTLDLTAMDQFTGKGAKCTVLVEGDFPDPDYCLVGWINGADYGCNEDSQNVGEYIFVDGSLTATFTEDSYIFVKTTNNMKWYLTEAYTEETTSTFVTTGTEKMKVPGNVELTFTLNVNEDGSITLSYTVKEEEATFTVSGTAKSGKDGDTTVELYSGETLIASTTVSGKEGTYAFEQVAAGTYTLKISKVNHVARTYTVTVGSEDVAQDVKIHLLGDLDGNGKVNTGDVAKLKAHLQGVGLLSDEYVLECANINGGKLNMGDVALLYAHCKGTGLLH